MIQGCLILSVLSLLILNASQLFFIVFSYSLVLAQCVERATGNMFASGYIRILQCSQSIRL